ncbi:MAG: LacI family DNA-binding transcriptional regulator [Christensenellales bacterium]|jgi:LacI family repressor for deo operon, udp, cdd, tsx, nupC, and nupG
MKKKYLNMKDIAALAGVSTATVSRVLNSPDLTSEKVRKKVLEVIDQHGYVPGQSARKLFSNAANSIVFFVYDMTIPFYIYLLRDLNKLAFEKNYALTICEIGDSYEAELRYYKYCKSIRASGIIYTTGPTRKAFGLDVNNENPIPIVLLDREPFEDRHCFEVRSDNRKGMSLLVDYLYKLGHRSIGYVSGPKTFYYSTERLQGFRIAMDKLGLDIPQEYIVHGTLNTANGIQAFDHFYSMQDAPTAVVCSNDHIARGFIMRANSLGIRIPDEFSVCGFDGFDSESFYPPTTSVRQNTAELAEAIMDFILHAESSPPPQTRLIDVSIEIGNTCRKISP